MLSDKQNLTTETVIPAVAPPTRSIRVQSHGRPFPREVCLPELH